MSFKVGDQVVFYNDGLRYRGSVSKITSPSLFDVVTSETRENNGEFTVHRKQCRKLGKKKPKTVWVNPFLFERVESGVPPQHVGVSFSDTSHKGWIEFIEVVRKKK